ncbi:hypothetical protein [Limimaricola cinnabarinus]|jgi:hypothetical protein|uniref:Uncharacterized protein n=1 Tax=Limimaricola cinnabarinus TaxID=1125964 RepID=A0A2G1MKE7_9RHOB|nr:hypothetical protein [Limimaricola cinnabarinus]PHP29167.1 hypothetical protein CJ301_01410 [Limimaricola cinnabarinus]
MAEGLYLDICLISCLRKHRHCIMIPQGAGAGDFTPLLDLDEVETVVVTVVAATAARRALVGISGSSRWNAMARIAHGAPEPSINRSTLPVDTSLNRCLRRHPCADGHLAPT